METQVVTVKEIVPGIESPLTLVKTTGLSFRLKTSATRKRSGDRAPALVVGDELELGYNDTLDVLYVENLTTGFVVLDRRKEEPLCQE